MYSLLKRDRKWWMFDNMLVDSLRSCLFGTIKEYAVHQETQRWCSDADNEGTGGPVCVCGVCVVCVWCVCCVCVLCVCGVCVCVWSLDCRLYARQAAEM